MTSRTEDAQPLEASQRREVHHGDAMAFLEQRGVMEGCSFVTSLPDVSELPRAELASWSVFFRAAAASVLRSTPSNGVAIFYQTDIKVEGVWVDKARLVQDAAEELGAPQLFHRVVCRKPPGTLMMGRPGYAHLLCFSRGLLPRPGRGWADVIPDGGEVTWTRGMGTRACAEACRFVLEHTDTRTVVDPFCGHGTVLAVANELGLNAVGVELSIKRVRKARALRTQGLRVVAREGPPPTTESPED